jgi:hypothetical protein
MMLCGMILHLSQGMRDFIFYMSRPRFFHHLFFNLRVGESTLLVDGIRMLVDIIIVDPIRTNLISQATLFHGVIVTIATQAKDGLYGY